MILYNGKNCSCLWFMIDYVERIQRESREGIDREKIQPGGIALTCQSDKCEL
jgi:hypothetical protein